MMKLLVLALCVLTLLKATNAFLAVPTSRVGGKFSVSSGASQRRHPLHAEPTTSSDGATAVYQSIFNFTDSAENAVSKFERIDDAIMGGISTSAIRQIDNENFARWSGVCRTDGGGFCGTRTLPFEQPLKIADDAQGFYLMCRFTSDDEPERRVWKMTTRTENSRGEQLYQAMFDLRKSSSDDDEWQRILVPFDSFSQVRGPRLVAGAPALNVTGGIFQIGMSLSKFQIGANTTELPDFRAGYFELQVKEIGVYSNKLAAANTVDTSLLEIDQVQTLTKEEAKKKRPIVFKLLSPVTSLLFSERGRRRQSAKRILVKRGYSRSQIASFAFRNRKARKGLLGAILETAAVSFQDAFRFVLGATLRYVVFLPFVLCLRVYRTISGLFKKKKVPATS